MIILDMDMPKSCKECIFCLGFEEWDGCLVGGSGDDWLKDRRADDCPIIAELPNDKPWAVYDENANALHFHDIIKD